MSLPVPVVPSGLGAFSLSSASYSLSLPNTITSGRERRDGTVYHADVVGKSGTVRNRAPSLDAIEIELSGMLLNSTDVIMAKKIIGESRVTLSRGGLTLEGGVTEYQIRERITSKLWDFRLTILSEKHYWTGDTILSGPNPVSIVNSGDIVSPPTLAFTGGSGGATGVSTTIGGRTATYNGALGLGEVLTIDCESLEASLNGSGVLGGMNSAFFTKPPRINPGVNTVITSVVGSASLAVSFTERLL